MPEPFVGDQPTLMRDRNRGSGKCALLDAGLQNAEGAMELFVLIDERAR